MAWNHLRTTATFTPPFLRSLGREAHLCRRSSKLATCQSSRCNIRLFEKQEHQTYTNCNSYSSGAPLSQQVESQEQKLSENDEVSPNFINRNPRNLERMALAYKDKGWDCSYPRRDYWHRLIVEQSNRHITAYVEHNNGHHVISASTKEWAIKKQLYALNDVSAADSIGRVLAQRCLEAGISYVNWRILDEVFSTEKIQKLRAAAQDEGLVLTEPRAIVDFNRPINYFPDMDHDEKKL